ncbi:MAG TPA: rhodanese-like domain-containing protein [Bryobacteraceae bacterium]|nr:rhodanese-like domain-containing protein [Bryobacteraceae bacterium]
MPFELRLGAKALAASAVLGTGAVLALAAMAGSSSPAAVSTDATVDAMITERDHVGAPELARWIIEKRTDYLLIDIREPWAFDDYHIPTAVNVPLAELFKPANLAKLDRTKTTVVYGLGAGHSAQTQLLLQLKGYKSLSLKEGISAWWEEVMTPASLRGAEPSPSGYQQARQLRERFMAAPGNSSSRSTGAAPPPVSSPAPGAPATPKTRLKLGRGCG